MIKLRSSSPFSFSISFAALIFGISTICGLTSADKLVGLNGDSQNSRYVEIRRSPGNRRPVDIPSLESMPKAHGLNEYGDSTKQIRRAPQSSSTTSNQQQLGQSQQFQQQPQQQQQQQQQPSSNGYGFSSPFASMIPGMPSLGNYQQQQQHPQFPMMLPQMHHPSLPSHSQLFPQFPPHPLMSLHHQHPYAPVPAQSPQQQQSQVAVGGVATATLSPSAQIPTLSATQAPMFTFPTLPTISFPTFPSMTMPPAFDNLLSTPSPKKIKRRKQPKRQRSNNENDDTNSHESKHYKKQRKLEKVKKRLPQYVAESDDNENQVREIPFNHRRKQKN